jgi:ribonucleoside-diphosphate reductase alpha chain
MISLSNLTDDRMRHAKSGEWWNQNKQRALANNSVSFTEKPDVGAFLREWTSLYESKSGERGIFNRVASQKQAEKYGRRDPNHEFGTNPCSEIILRPYQFCNLTEVVIRPEDDKDSLCKKVRLASILGTIQATLVNFPYLRRVWEKNTAEERLLGVSLTGIMDNKLMNSVTETAKDTLEAMRVAAVSANAEHADMLGIPRSTAITCVKPSGTVSQLVDAASGIHTRHSDFYFRTVRGDNKDPLTQFMVDQGIHAEPDVMNPETTTVLTFPIMSPQDAITRENLTAIEHLELWKMYQEFWCEHKPSITISVHEHEWPEVGAWVFNNFDDISGISFLPHDGGSYRQAPYQEVEYEDYLEMANLFPKKIEWNDMVEEEDTTTGSQELACSSGSCEIM